MRDGFCGRNPSARLYRSRRTNVAWQTQIHRAVIIVHPWGVQGPEKLLFISTHPNNHLYKNRNSFCALCWMESPRMRNKFARRNVRRWRRRQAAAPWQRIQVWILLLRFSPCELDMTAAETPSWSEVQFTQWNLTGCETEKQTRCHDGRKHRSDLKRRGLLQTDAGWWLDMLPSPSWASGRVELLSPSAGSRRSCTRFLFIMRTIPGRPSGSATLLPQQLCHQLWFVNIKHQPCTTHETYIFQNVWTKWGIIFWM